MPEVLQINPEIQNPTFDLNNLLTNLTNAEEQWQDQGLPIAQNIPKLKQVIKSQNNIILEAETGSGKSTVAPAIFLHELLLDDPYAKIIVTQPRRLATQSVSGFVGQKVGSDYVDYRYKGHGISKVNARIQFTVEQSLLNDLIENETLDGYDTVMIDEVHERSITIDILLPLLKRAQKLRQEQHKKPLKVILASGTMDATALPSYFKGAYQEHIEGRAFQVDQFFSDTEIPADDIPKAAAQKAAALLAEKDEKGDMLIFMPGKWEIDKTKEEIESIVTDPNVEIVTIMGGDQDGDPYQKINNNPGNKRRIYIATDAAETSITIPKITMVIDSGLMKKMVYDPTTRITTLETLEHTLANWKQRIGRAGRVMEGRAFALFTKKQLEDRPKNQQAEFLRTDLTPQILKMKAIGIKDVHNFDYIEHPGEKTINQAIISLQQLGALDTEGNITMIGKEMATIDEDPHFARMLIEAKKRNCVEAVTLLIGFMKTKKSLFSFNPKRDSFQTKYAQYIDPTSDFITALNIWKDSMRSPRNFDWQNKGIDQNVMRNADRERKELEKNPFLLNLNFTMQNITLTPEQREAINLSVAAGFMDKLLVREPNGMYKFEDSASSGIKLDQSSGVAMQYPEKILCGKMWSNKKYGKETYAMMNIIYNQEELMREFEYLRKIKLVEDTISQEEHARNELSSLSQKPSVSQKNTINTNVISKELQLLQNKSENKPLPTIRENMVSFFKNIGKEINNLNIKTKQFINNIVKRIRSFFR